MISLWPHWQRPFLFILLPIFIGLLWKIWHYHMSQGSWQKLIPTIFQPWLLKGMATKESALPKLILSLASLLAFIALLGPSWQHIEQPPLKIDSPLVIVLDLTPNMLSTDIPPSRLASAKRKVLDIIKARKDAQTAVIVYSGSAHILVPLSDDQSTIANLLESISPTIMPSIGHKADLGIKRALDLLTNTQQRTYGQILLVTTGLTTTEKSAIQSLLANQTIPLNILGVGTAQGAPIVTTNGEFLKDDKGQIVLPKLDITALKDFANTQGGRYASITLNDSDIHSLNLANIKGGERQTEETEKRVSDYWQDQGYWLILPLLLLAAFAGRKGWLFCIPLLFMLPSQPANAYEWNQLWLNKNQQGQQLLKEDKPKEAAKRFEDQQWQGYASYQAKEYAHAEQQFAKQTSPEGIYNYGNTLARQGKYKEAITAWNKAIEAKPNFEQAMTNKKIVEDLLKKQQQQKNQPSNQDNNQQSNGQPQADNPPNQSQQQSQKQQPQEGDKSQQNSQQQQTGNQSQNAEQQQKNQQQEGERQSTQSNDKEQDGQQNKSAPKDQQTREQRATQASPDKQQTNENGRIQSNDDLNNQEQSESLQQWMRTIPDDPSELLRRKFYYEQRYNRSDKQ